MAFPGEIPPGPYESVGRRNAGLKPGPYKGGGREPMGMIGDGFVDLADVAFDDAAFDGHGPHGDEAEVGGAAGDGQRNHPAVGRLFRANDAQRLGDEDAESFARIVAEPTSVEVVEEPRLEIVFGAFGDDGDVGVEIVKRLALARKGHSTIPDDDFHGRRGR